MVSSPAHTKKPLQKTLLVSFKEILLGGPKFAQAANTPLHLQDLRDYPFISLGGRTSTRETSMELFLQRGLPFQPDMEASATDQILPMIMHNAWHWFFPGNTCPGCPAPWPGDPDPPGRRDPSQGCLSGTGQHAAPKYCCTQNDRRIKRMILHETDVRAIIAAQSSLHNNHCIKNDPAKCRIILRSGSPGHILHGLPFLNVSICSADGGRTPSSKYSRPRPVYLSCPSLW